MDQNNDENNIVHSAPEISNTPEVGEPEPIASSADVTEKKPPSRMRTFFRKALIWFLVGAAIFIAGFLTDHFLRFKPVSDSLKETQSDLVLANQEVSDLQEENNMLVDENQAANEEITDLEEALTTANAHLQFIQVLVDVNNAQINLFLEDTEGALLALEDTQQRLEEIQSFIAEKDAELALSLTRRLELIVSGLERDPETARIDLDLVTKDLLELEPLLFTD